MCGKMLRALMVAGALAGAHALPQVGRAAAVPAPEPTLARRLQTGAVNPIPMTVSPTPTSVQGNIARKGAHAWYSFVVQSPGQEFQFDVELGTLEDSVMDLVDVDRETVLVENDDTDNSLASHIEWTAPAAGTYFVMVKAYGSETGTFTLTATGSLPTAGAAGDACTSPVALHGAGTISHMPKGNYQDTRTCDWTITCQAGETATFTFTQLDTEADYDFVTLFDGSTAQAATQIDQVSGNLVDMATRSYRSTGPAMTVEFSSDDSIGARGFEGQYACASGAGGPAPPPITGDANTVNNNIQTDGTAVQSEIARVSEHQWFQFTATAGNTYEIETQLGSLPDSVISLVGTDRETIILENDDGERADGMASFIEWTCPADGTYYVLVRGYQRASGTFQIMIADTTSGAHLSGGSSGDPCNGGATLTGQGSLSFQPDGNYQDNQNCAWTINCAGGTPSLRFTDLDTETDYDIVHVFDGPATGGSELAQMSGSFVDQEQTTFSGTGSTLAVTFTSDESIGAGGFLASYSCGGGGGPATHIPVPPPPPIGAASTDDLSFSIRVCIDHIDDLYFQDSRMWIQYGGQWGAAGQGCGDMAGKAYVAVNGGDEQVWDISALGECSSGAACPPVTLDLGASFTVPECAQPVTEVEQTAGRGTITVPAHPSAGNGFRGELEFNDNTFDGRDVYAANVLVSCGPGADNKYVYFEKGTGDIPADGFTWHQAEDYCLGLGMTLANIHNAEDQAAALEASGGEGGWIGLTDDDHDLMFDYCPGSPGCYSSLSNTEGEFLFTDGTLIGTMENGQWTANNGHFSNWAQGEPNEAQTNAAGEDCVYMKGAGSGTVCELGQGSGCWNDYPCDPTVLPNHSRKSFICGPKAHGVRLACANTVGTGTCHQGRIEVINPYTMQWGTVCGHHVWNNDEAANIVCQELGFQSGTIYTYGATQTLPALPIVGGYRECAGGEHSFFDCPTAGNPQDPTGISGVDPSCTHSIDQGAICEDDRVTGRTKPGIAVCAGAKLGLAATGQNGQTHQPVVFGCIDYYTSQCHYSVTNAEVGGCATCGSYTRALRAFARCVENTATGVVGYCHGSLQSTAHLANQYVCDEGLNRNIGFHIRIPFHVNMPGLYTFRIHADYGLGSFIGVDGAEHTPGNTWGHLQLTPSTLTAGDHEFESLGFEDCCDGHSELEVHLPCDQVGDVWRLVVAGPSDCLICGQAGQSPGDVMQSIPVQNYDFETFTAAGQPATLPNGQWVHFGTEVGAGNNGNTQLPEPIEIPGWVAHEYTDPSQCAYSGGAATGCTPCGSADASCGQGLFHQSEHDVAIGVNVLFLNSGYVEQQLQATVQPDTTYIISVEAGGGNAQNNGGYYFGFYTPDGTEIHTISHQTGGPPASAQNFVAVSTSFDSADHPEAIGQPLVIRLGKDQEGQAHYHDVVVQSRPTSTATAASSLCSAQTTSAGFCGVGGTTRPVQVGDTTQGGTAPVGGADSHCTNPGNTGQLDGTNGYGQGNGQPLTPGESTTVHLQVCVDHQDDIYFQDDRIWFQYGGQYSATGTHGDCPQGTQGVAMVNGQQHDISALSACSSGTSCPPVQVAPQDFSMPTGCQEMQMTVEKSTDATAVYNQDRPDLITNRGDVTVPTHPTALNGWRGEVEITDHDGGAVAYDIVVTITCMGTGTDTNVRLGCTHQVGTTNCHQGRIEVLNPVLNQWGTVCGHWYWDNDNAADIVCRQLGYEGGTLYTFGNAVQSLPELPIVAGYRTCDGTEASIMDCAPADGLVNGADPDCANGCSDRCSHAIDQGAMCYTTGQVGDTALAIESCRGYDNNGPARALADAQVVGGNGGTQEIVFGCIDFYSTHCAFDATNTNTRRMTYSRALRAFAACAEVVPEPMGFCHGALPSAAHLSNQAVCEAGTPTDIGFHIRIPFTVSPIGAGSYTFRMHADFGLGSFMGVDGATSTPGNLYGHITIGPVALTVGDHEFEALGFEDCCDGSQELEVHLPCDSDSSGWRIVTAGETDCLKCSVGEAASTCSSQTVGAGDCANGVCTGGNYWGNAAGSFNLRICIDQQDDVFYQDNRLWISYGGMYSAAGAHGSCPEEYRGTAYVDDQPWDISALSACSSGSTCQVSTSYTSPTFSVPTGCAAVHSQVVKNSGRGYISTPVEPQAGNGWRGEIEIVDDPGSAGVYDLTVTLTCAGSATPPTVRLGCTHNAGTGSCHQGRVEVLNPVNQQWGTVCGHWFWNNDNAANIVCRDLGYIGGTVYTFGVSHALPQLPIVAGFRACEGTEDTIWDCPMCGATGQDANGQCNDWPGHPQDPTGVNGMDTDCNHAIDQGVICYDAARPSQTKLPACSGCGAVAGCGQLLMTGTGGNNDANGYQSVVFGCIDYYTTLCVYDVSNMEGSGQQGAAFSRALRQFATCADRNPQPVGYCHGAISTAAQLSNQAVCEQGSTLNIGFHIRIPFRVLQAGTFTFRMHADYGLGSFIGVDGAEHTPGNLWGHVQLDPAQLAFGDHEFEALGFDDCCDGHQELEVHLNCDVAAAPWRVVTSGRTDCMSCTHTAATASCSAESQCDGSYDCGQAAHCGTTGGAVACTSSAGGCGAGNSYFDGEEFFTDSVGINPRDHKFSLDLKMKTSSGNGIQLIAGRTADTGATDHVAMEVVAGKEVFDISTGENPVTARSDSSVNDNQWHVATGIRSGNLESRLQLDGVTFESTYTDEGIAPGRSITTTEPLYIGGHPSIMDAGNDAQLGLTTHDNFIGCMGAVHYEQLFEMADTDSSSGTVSPGTCGPAPGLFISADGDQYEDCTACCADDSGGCRHCVCYDRMGHQDNDGAGSDNSRNSGQFDGGAFLTFGTGVNPAAHTFVLTFSIKTSATDAIVLVSNSEDGTCDTAVAGACTASGSVNDHLVVQIVGGKLQFAYGLGSDCQSGLRQSCENNVVVESANPINDNQWHVIRAARPGSQMSVLTIDGVSVEAQGDGPNLSIDLTEPLFIGGHPNPGQLERGLTATQNFVGCLSDVYYEIDYDMPEHHCGSGAKTYDGQTFDEYASTGLDVGSNLFTFSFSFKTRNSDGLIFIGGMPPRPGDPPGLSRDHIAVEILQGQLHFDFSTGGVNCNVNLHSNARVDDGQWHHVTARRLPNNRGNAGSLRVDGVDVTGGPQDPSCGAHGIDIREAPLYIGGRPVFRDANTGWDDTATGGGAFCDATLAARTGCTPQAQQQVNGAVDSATNFAGCLSGIRVDQVLPQGQPDDGTCSDGPTPAGHRDGTNWGQTRAGAVNPGGNMFSLSFSFKTTSDGALIISHGNGAEGANLEEMTDHIVLEVFQGKVHLDLDAGTDSAGNVGDVGQQSNLHIESEVTVTDGQWHHVTATRTGPQSATLSVDEVMQTGSGTGHYVGINIDIPTYIGGHPQFEQGAADPSRPIPGVQSTSHFTGCMTDVRYTLDFGAIRHVASLDGHYEVVPQPMPYQAARQYCQQNDYDLASIHSSQEQQFAADQCAKFSQRERVSMSSECQHTLANGDVNSASNTWISNSEEWEFVGCFVSSTDGTSHTDPWPDAAGLATGPGGLAYGQEYPGVKLLNWEGCRQAARAAGYNTFSMENPMGRSMPGYTGQFTAPAGYAQCEHMDIIAHGNYHDQGHNGAGRAPDSDCATVVDTEGHFLGGQWRHALYATASTAQCLRQSAGDASGQGNVHTVEECSPGNGGVPEDYVPTLGDGSANDLGNQWHLVGCFVSDQDGNSHADPWSDGQRWVEASWYECRQKAVDEGSAVFAMEYGQGYATAGHASCGHMNVINHGNFHVSTDSDAQHFINVMGGNTAGDTGHNGYGRAPLGDCMGEIDDAGHALGGPWRFALYAQRSVAQCLNDFHMGETSPHGCWIGLTDDVGADGVASDDTGRFEWTDQSPRNYMHWATGEPNGGGGTENYVELDMRGSLDATAESTSLNRQGGWNDQPAAGDGNLGKYPVCETRAPDKKNVAGIHTLNGATNTQQYVAVGQRMTWTDARAYCRSQYSDLASIHSQASNDYVRQICQQQIQALGGVQGGHSSCWIGANDKDTEGTEVWSDGTEIDYDDWYPGEPNNVQNTVVNGVEKDEDVTEFRIWCNPADACCASRTCPGWNDNRDDRLYPFICEEHSRPQGGGH